MAEVQDDLMRGVARVIERAVVKSGARGLKAYVDQVKEDRDACSTRGYHQLQSKSEFDAKDKDGICICIDCELWFGKNDISWIKVQFVED